MRLFPMSSGRARVRLVQAGTALVAAALIAGCGNTYRPVVTPINPSGPAAQPTSYAVVVSSPSPTSPGIVTIIDYSGDTVMAIAPIGPGPNAFVMDQLGATGYTVNSDGTLANFPITTSLQAKNGNLLHAAVLRTAGQLDGSVGGSLGGRSEWERRRCVHRLASDLQTCHSGCSHAGNHRWKPYAPGAARIRDQPELHRSHRRDLQYRAHQRTHGSGHTN